jgi:hypothetical protein
MSTEKYLSGVTEDTVMRLAPHHCTRHRCVITALIPILVTVLIALLPLDCRSTAYSLPLPISLHTQLTRQGKD